MRGDESNSHVTDNVKCLVIIIAKDDNNITAVQFKIKHFDFLRAKAVTAFSTS